MHLVCRHRATALDDHGLLWTEEAPLTCANAGIDASHRVRRCNGAPLITQRSQVQILPPLQVKSQVRGPFSPRGGRASCVRDRTVTANLSLIHISEPTRLGMISYAVFCLKKKKKKQ